MRGEEFKLTLLWRPKPPRPPQYSQDEREEPKVGKRCDFFRALFDIQCVFSYSMHLGCQHPHSSKFQKPLFCTT